MAQHAAHHEILTAAGWRHVGDDLFYPIPWAYKTIPCSKYEHPVHPGHVIMSRANGGWSHYYGVSNAYTERTLVALRRRVALIGDGTQFETRSSGIPQPVYQEAAT